MTRPGIGWRVAGGLALLAGAIGLQTVAVAARPERTFTDVLYVQSPQVARKLSLSFDALAADLYWMRALQHFGGTRLQEGPRTFEHLFPYLDLATSLDPRFTVAYRFGAIFLSEQQPGGPGRPDLALKLLEKGMQASPDKWQYYMDAGFVHYWWTREYDKAAAAFTKGADVPGAPWWLRQLAAVTLAEGGDRQSSRLLFRTLAQTPDNEWVRTDAMRRLRQLDALDELDRLNALVEQAKGRGAQAPWSWLTLFDLGLLGAPPIDPSGTPYEMDLSTGRVTVSSRSPLSPLPDEPRPMASVLPR